MTPTVSEILAALAAHTSEANANDLPNTFGGEQIRRAMHWGNERFPREMRALIEAGVVRVVHRQAVRIDGRRTTVPAYHFMVPEHGKRK